MPEGEASYRVAIYRVPRSGDGNPGETGGCGGRAETPQQTKIISSNEVTEQFELFKLAISQELANFY